MVFTGWLGGDEINWLRSHVAIGLLPYIEGAPQGLSNKLFEYLSAGIPVVSSLRGETMRLIEAHGCGVTYVAGDTSDCLAKIGSVADDDVNRIAMGQRGLALFADQFDSPAVFAALEAHLEAVVERYTKRERPVETDNKRGPRHLVKFFPPALQSRGPRRRVPASSGHGADLPSNSTKPLSVD